MAKLDMLSAAAAIQFVSVPTCTGVADGVVEPSPNCPFQFPPHAHKLPSSRIPSMWPCPAVTERQRVPGKIWVGGEFIEADGLGGGTYRLWPNCQRLPSF